MNYENIEPVRFIDPTYMIMGATDQYVGSQVYADYNIASAQAAEYAENTGQTYHVMRIEATTQFEAPKPVEYKAYTVDLYGCKHFS